MKTPYHVPETNEEVLELAKNIVSVILEHEVSFQKASDALTAAQDLLWRNARPVIDRPIPSDD